MLLLPVDEESHVRRVLFPGEVHAGKILELSGQVFRELVIGREHLLERFAEASADCTCNIKKSPFSGIACRKTSILLIPTPFIWSSISSRYFSLTSSQKSRTLPILCGSTGKMKHESVVLSVCKYLSPAYYTYKGGCLFKIMENIRY